MAPTKRANGQSDPTRKRVKISEDDQLSKPKGKVQPASDQANAAAAAAAAAAPAAAPVTDHFDRVELVTGSYERLLYGFQTAFDASGALSMKAIFSFPAHLSCIKTCVCSPGGGASSNGRRWLVTSSTDDTVKLWDLARRKEVGMLVGHEAPATHMQFLGHGNKQLLTCSEDGTLKLFRTKDWALIRNFKGHKARVNYVDVHPGGRIALSVSADRTLRFWDLLGSKESAAGGGKQGSSSTKLGAEGDLVRWNNKGDRFAVICGREDMQRIATLESKSRFHDVKFVQLEQECMVVACEDGKGRLFVEQAGEVVCVAELIGHSNRIKEMHHVPLVKPDGTVAQFIFTASSDGRLHAYDITSVGCAPAADGTAAVVEASLQHDTKGSRLTCLSVTGYLTGQAPALGDEDASSSDDDDTSSDDDDSSNADSEDVELLDSDQEDTEEAEWQGLA